MHNQLGHSRVPLNLLVTAALSKYYPMPPYQFDLVLQFNSICTHLPEVLLHWMLNFTVRVWSAGLQTLATSSVKLYSKQLSPVCAGTYLHCNGLEHQMRTTLANEPDMRPGRSQRQCPANLKSKERSFGVQWQ